MFYFKKKLLDILNPYNHKKSINLYNIVSQIKNNNDK
jgi:hypothetical protein